MIAAPPTLGWAFALRLAAVRIDSRGGGVNTSIVSPSAIRSHVIGPADYVDFAAKE